jgi:hypothetical protein
MDGDGTVSVYGKFCSLCCRFSTKSKKFAEDFCSLPFVENLSCHEQKSGMYNVSVVGGKKNIASFLEKMYKNKGTFYLERKYEHFVDQISKLLKL